MSFSNVQKALYNLQTDPLRTLVPGAASAIALAFRRDVPLLFQPLINASATTETHVYPVAGRNYHSVIAYMTPGGATPSMTLRVWGSQTNVDGSFVLLATIATSATGETVIKGYYNFLLFEVSAYTSGNLTVDVLSVHE